MKKKLFLVLVLLILGISAFCYKFESNDSHLLYCPKCGHFMPIRDSINVNRYIYTCRICCNGELEVVPLDTINVEK